MKAEDLFGQLSYTGKPFDCGYYVTTREGTVYFAEGEETERDNYLEEKGVFDDEALNWEMLFQYNEDCFYYSEWFVEDDMDGGYDSEGDYWDYLNGKFIKE